MEHGGARWGGGREEEGLREGEGGGGRGCALYASGVGEASGEGEGGEQGKGGWWQNGGAGLRVTRLPGRRRAG